MKLHRAYFISFHLSNVGQFFLVLNSKGLYQSSGKEKESCCLVFPSSKQKKHVKLGTSIVQRRLKNRDRRAKLLCFKSKPFAFLSFSCPSPSSLLKLPNVYRLFVRREKKKWLLSGEVAVSGDSTTDCFHSRCRQLCKFIRTKDSFYIRKKSNPHRVSFLVL